MFRDKLRFFRTARAAASGWRRLAMAHLRRLRLASSQHNVVAYIAGRFTGLEMKPTYRIVLFIVSRVRVVSPVTVETSILTA